ncbi:hypothetical protein RhiirA5_442605, partial [Rhizophagus irregularis]
MALDLDYNFTLYDSVTKENYYAQKKEIYLFYNYLKTIRDDNISKWRIDRIDYYITQRNQDLTTNQTKMINSILQRKPRKISLDRLVFKDDNDELVFTNNPNIIEKEAIKHYQNTGKHEDPTIYKSVDELPSPWNDVYNPDLCNIDANHWSALNQDITIFDLISTLKNCSNNKAPGPSQITYEDLKHLHESVFKILTQIFNKCLQLDLIPSKWRDALLFPIPKPHDWDSKLTNTRPITLLETTRKLMV